MIFFLMCTYNIHIQTAKIFILSKKSMKKSNPWSFQFKLKRSATQVGAQTDMVAWCQTNSTGATKLIEHTILDQEHTSTSFFFSPSNSQLW